MASNCQQEALAQVHQSATASGRDMCKHDCMRESFELHRRRKYYMYMLHRIRARFHWPVQPLGREEKGGENIRVEKDEIPATLFSTPQEE
ncbi:unnamed protein product [Darwinula stevensoni]|uniref:Uncharacterized protein n=1 Tax=Darwinula stevensoni TaxID=69355 RepID=A0A7R8XAZ4_9CRUS|nr:unnamed protein product [Darwinula stevensoni]CAG0884294.1 unnamed protein product [Darwinula stevensoni]